MIIATGHCHTDEYKIPLIVFIGTGGRDCPIEKVDVGIPGGSGVP
jgi:hypothetical protein